MQIVTFKACILCMDGNQQKCILPYYCSKLYSFQTFFVPKCILDSGICQSKYLQHMLQHMMKVERYILTKQLLLI